MAVSENGKTDISSDENPDSAMDSASETVTEVETEKEVTEKKTTTEDEAKTTASEEVTENVELTKYWKAVTDNPTDFTGWTYLLQYVEQEAKIEDARTAFDAFLKQYPYCYGYWKKYADLEKKTGHSEITWKVFERAVSATPMSIDLWVHYINFAQESYAGHEDKEKNVRKLYERAIAAAGLEFRSDKLWENYIEWERQYKNYKNMAALWDRLIAVPIQLYSHHYDNYVRFIKEQAPRDILSLDEFMKLRLEVVSEYQAKQETQEDKAEDKPDEDDDATEEAPPGELPPGEEAPPGEEGKTVKTQDPEEETKAIREKVLEIRKDIHKLNEEEVSRRWAYEEGIRRPYFHVKPLEKSQINNWHAYIDFEISLKKADRVTILFERCLVACALYEEFWIKYASFMMGHDMDEVRNIYKRACETHLQKKPSIHLAWAAYEEKQGCHDAALEIIDNLEKRVPGLAMVKLREASIKRRQGDLDGVKSLFEKALESTDKVEEKSFYAIKYARCLAKVEKNEAKAEEVLTSALEKDATNHKLLLQLIDLEFRKNQMDEEKMLQRFNQAIKADLAIEHRVAFSQRKLEFLEDFSNDIDSLIKGYEDHQELVKELQTTKKRKSEETDTTVSKKAKTDTSSTTNGAGDATTTQNATDNTSYQQSYSHGSHQQGPQAYPPPQQQYQQQDYSNQYNQYNQGWGNYGGYNSGGYNQGWNYQNQGYYGSS